LHDRRHLDAVADASVWIGFLDCEPGKINVLAQTFWIKILGQSVNRSPIAATGTALPSHRVEAQFLLVLRLSAQTVYQQIVPQDLVFERAKFLDIPIGAQIPALGPVGLSRA
jgi:hypothetical protein